jgi:apolipoprotein D and lipocalin family protein
MFSRFFLIVYILFVFAGCANTNNSLQTVERVDVVKYLGTWYEIARYENFFEKGCIKPNATYSLQKNGTIKVENRCIKNGKSELAIGEAYAIDETFSKLKVSFFWPFYGDYQIIMLDENYTYAVIGEPSRKYFWILGRSQKLDDKIKREILEKMSSFEYDKNKLIWNN